MEQELSIIIIVIIIITMREKLQGSAAWPPTVLNGQ